MDKQLLSDQIIQQLESHILVFENLLSNLPEPVIHWKQSSETWNLLEVIGHLLDEERLDFKDRILQLFNAENSSFKPIDPLNWVKENSYSTQIMNKQLEAFKLERTKSIAWLQTINIEQLEKAFEHQHFGKMSGHMLLQNWLVHDYIHIRQILKIKYAYLASCTNENLSYAGNW